MTRDIRKIHEEVFQFLVNSKNHEHDLQFSLRKSNRAGKLEHGYWFHGTDEYLAVSFWTGIDFKNRIPNISFVIKNDGYTSLDINVSDSEKKKEFVDRFLMSETGYLQMQKYGNRYRKEYSLNEFSSDYLQSLGHFLRTDKIHIDNVIREYGPDISVNEEERFNFIKYEEFDASLSKIMQYRSTYFGLNSNVTTQFLSGFQIENYGPIKNTNLINIGDSMQWVFLVGENGTGKTSILRAIAKGLSRSKFKGGDVPYIKLILSDNLEQTIIYERTGNHDLGNIKEIVAGFCGYGASRLKTSSEYQNKFSFKRALAREGLINSLFSIDTILIDIQDQLNYWNRSGQMFDIVTKRKQYIKELLIDILPNVYNIHYSEVDQWENTLYIEKDNFGNELPPVRFEMLASGLKSLIAMIGDMMMKLFSQQPDITDPSELTGIVLIDEIDVHLHPNLQKYLVEQLTITFPKVQFIASTHSPIPLLGAPLNSKFFKVVRGSENGVELVDLTEIGVHQLLPNAILTSDLFGMHELFERSYPEQLIRTEDTVLEMVVNDSVKAELKLIADKLKREL